MSQDFGLKENDISMIIEVLKLFPEIEKVVIYGSRAKGNHRNGSDIDLTLIGKNLNLDNLNRLSSKLDDLLLPYLFDISIYDKIDNPDLINHIDRIGKSFFLRE